ncbi:flagellar hook-associated protein 2 [Desulfuromonas versatilis]|uniref:Flagellar hook-associated protein 2 n=1 Tax=Desulfuromonas versatilis TaxID=2802975 RepID=A0ABN6E349_9BACT|nr:flagellar filament capping protein FliD [Desulfuromonas versatilis]BCR06599.1 flagellar hook-associated protein 2 [Desulfuromonas versatilis]
MGISFGGLATGMDTTSLVSSLMEIERKPIERMTLDMTYQSNRLAALTEFNGKLTSLLSKVEALDSSDELRPMTAKLSTEGFLTAKADTTAVAGNYQIKSHALAQVEKVVSTDALAWADKDAKQFKTGTLSLSVDGVEKAAITIDDSNNSLTGIMQAINAANTGDDPSGVSATIINDGDEYRLVLTGATVNDKNISLDASGLSGGSGTYANPTLGAPVQNALKAHIEVDGIHIYSDTNTFSEAVPGTTLTLSKADGGSESTTLTVGLDEGGLKKKVQDFVSAYNAAISFVTSQSAYGDNSSGVLGSDSGLNMIKRRLQGLLVNPVNGSGSIQTLAELGFETQKDGTVKLNDSKLSKALSENPSSVEKLLAGEKDLDGKETVKGIAGQFRDYLDDITDSVDGFYVGRKNSIDSTIRKLDASIERVEARLEAREKTLIDQFTALEQLVSSLNSQSDYLGQQMDMLSNIWSSKK